MMKTKTTFPILLMALLVGGFCNGQDFVSAEYLNTTSATVLNSFSEVPGVYDVDYYKIIYTTQDLDGNQTNASGGLAIPVSDACEYFPLAAYCHGTVLKQLDAPSQNNPESILARVFASSGFITVAPDYLGLGENPGIHPYLHQKTQATATLDLITAARTFLQDQGGVQNNGEAFITGYSQGGHAAMGTLKYAQENGMLQEYGILAGAPCSGPYQLSGTQTEVILSDEPYSNPGYIIYTLVSFQAAYGNLYSELSDVVNMPYAEDVAPYFDGAQNSYSMNVVNNILPSLTSELLVDTTLANFESNPNHPLRVALADNDNYNWVPEMPLRLFYCSGDEQVFFSNSTETETWMTDAGAEDVEAINVLPGANHGDCVQPALVEVYEFFSEIATPCIVTNSFQSNKVKKRLPYPNPTSKEIEIELDKEHGELVIRDTQGRYVMDARLEKGKNSIDISGIPAGTYIVYLTSNEGSQSWKIVKE